MLTKENKSSVINCISDRIYELSEKNSFVTVAIDGRCASGKTTLANMLKDELLCNIIHMDDFFLRPEQRNSNRMNEPGGNIDYERFLTEVINPLKSHKQFYYRPYCCKTKELKTPVFVPALPVTIIEGSYSCHPSFGECFDIRIFFDIDRESQMQRLTQRNGSEQAEIFQNLWIPLEEKYFSCFNIKEKCDLIF